MRLEAEGRVTGAETRAADAEARAETERLMRLEAEARAADAEARAETERLREAAERIRRLEAEIEGRGEPGEGSVGFAG